MTNTRKIGATGLSLHVLKPSTPPKVKKTTAEVARWCAALPMADTGAAAKKLFIALDEITNTEMTAMERFAILELLRTPNKNICTSLKRHYIEQKSPLTERKLMIANLRETLITYMADNYKLIFEELHIKGARSNEDKTMLATALIRILYYMNVLLVCRYQLYTYAPENVWKEIHLIYKYAKEKGLLELQAKCEFAPNRKMTSVLEAYTRIILLSATDPYQWRQREQHSINKAIELWALYPTLYEYQNIPNTKAGIYIIELDKDEPPTLYGFRKEPVNKSCIALDLSKGVKHLKDILDKMQNNHLKAKIDNPNDPEFSVTAPTVAKLVSLWSQHIVRSSERFPIKADIKIAFGLSAAYYYVNGQKEFNPHPSNLRTSFGETNTRGSQYMANLPVFEVSDDAEEEITIADVPAATPSPKTNKHEAVEVDATTDKEDLYHIYDYSIENTSRNGFCIIVRDKSYPPFQAGEIVVFKNTTEANVEWGIGAIRWLRRLKNEEFHIGVQLIAPYAKAAGIQMLRGDKLANRLLRCLVLPENEPEKIPPMLITTSFPVHSNTVMLYLDNSEPIKAKLTKEIDASGMYYLYEYTTEANVEIITPSNLNGPTIHKTNRNADGDPKTNTEFDSIWGDL
jgi:hypothetical protein